MSAASAVPRLATSILGIPGAIDRGVDNTARGAVHLNDTAVRYLWNKVHGSPLSWSDADRAQIAAEALAEAKHQRALTKSPVARYLNSAANVSRLPTGDQIEDVANHAIRSASNGHYTGLYQPQTAAGRTIASVVGNLAAAAAGPGALIPRLIAGATGGLAGSAAREAVHAGYPGNPSAEAAADFAGNIVGGFSVAGGNAIRVARATAAERGANNAARAMREGLIDPAEAQARLAAFNAADPAARHAAFNPTTSQVIGTQDAAQLENHILSKLPPAQANPVRLQRKNTLAASGTPIGAEVADHAPLGTGVADDAPGVFAREPADAQVRSARSGDAADAGQAAVQQARDARTAVLADAKATHQSNVDQAKGSHAEARQNAVESNATAKADAIEAKTAALRDAEQRRAEGMAETTGAAPEMHNDAGATLQAHLADVHEGMLQRERDAWDKLNQSGVTVPVGESTAAVDDFLGKAKVAEQPALRDARSAIADMKGHEWPDGQIPIGEWQALRSRVSDTAALAADPNTRRLNRNLSDLLGKQIDGAMAEHADNPEIGNLWREALARTQERHSVFSDTGAGKAVAIDQNGLANTPENAVRNLLRGAGGTQGVRALRDSKFVDNNILDQALSDHYVGKLTGGGINSNVKTQAVDSLLKDPQASLLAKEVPAVGERLGEIRSAAESHDFAAQRLAEQHDTNLADIAEGGRTSLANLKAQHDADLAALGDQHASNVAALREQHGTGIADIADQNKVNLKAVSAANAEDVDLSNIQGAFRNAYASGPDSFANFMANHGDKVRAALAPEHHELLDQLESNANMLRSPQGESGGALPTLDAVASGDPTATFANDFSPRTQRAVNAAAKGVTLGAVPAAVAGVGVGSALSGLAEAALLGKVPKVGNLLFRSAVRRISGDAPQLALNKLGQAAHDPAVAESLLNRDLSAGPASNSQGALGAVGRSAVYGALKQPDYPPEQPEPAPTPAAPAVTPPADEAPPWVQPSYTPGASESVLQGKSTASSAPQTASESTLRGESATPTPSATDEVPPWLANQPKVKAAKPSADDETPPWAHASGGRVARKAGGKVDGVEHLVKGLMRKAERVRKHTAKSTEPLLNHGDDAIISALNAAKQGI